MRISILAAKLALAAAALALLLALPACKVNVRKNEDEGNKKVDIDTPVGALHVSEDADVRNIGLPVYPGARPRQKKAGEDGEGKSANVNISTPFFGLKVVAREFEADAEPDKVIAFYDNELKKYGKVLRCRSSWQRANDVRVDEGKDKSGKESKELTCENDNDGKATELKAGTKDNQHVVAIEPEGKGSKFALVYLQIRGDKDDTI